MADQDNLRETVLEMFDRGLSSRDIARELGITWQTAAGFKGSMPRTPLDTAGAAALVATAAVGPSLSGLELQMNKALRDNIHDLDPSFTIVDGGKERQIPGVGNIDILARDAAGRLVVIELKADEARDEVLAQVLDYVQGLIDEGEADPRAMLVAKGFSRRLCNAARRAGVELVTYGFSFTFTRNDAQAENP